MNTNNQVQSLYKCDSCFKPIYTGKEEPRFTFDGTKATKFIFCHSLMCKRGYEFSKPYPNLSFDLEKVEITETAEFKRYAEDKHSFESKKELAKELEEDWEKRLKKGEKIW